MLDLAIYEDTNKEGADTVLTNHGERLSIARWPRDCDFQLVAFALTGRTCSVIQPEELASDIAKALAMLDETGTLRKAKPDWYARLRRYARGSRAT